MDLHLNPDGPHSDDYTRHVAQALAESVRVLNHATLTPNTIDSPATVHDVIGSLHSAATRLDQLVRQLRDQLARLYETGQIGDAKYQPGYNVAATLLELEDAQTRANALADPLRRAHNASSGLYLREDDGS